MELAKKGVLVTRLSASEDAATMSVLCADKTGTISARAFQEANQDPIDNAFIAKAKLENLPVSSFVQRNFTPFDAKRRRTEALVQGDDSEFKVLKGAVKIIATACGLQEASIRDLESKMSMFAAKGYRTLAVARALLFGKNPPLDLVEFRDHFACFVGHVRIAESVL